MASSTVTGSASPTAVAGSAFAGGRHTAGTATPLRRTNALAVAALVVGAVALILAAYAFHLGSGARLAGAQGPSGATGSPGSPGAPGLNGKNGSNGANGANGTEGRNGTDGVNGSDGARGPPGPNLTYYAFEPTFVLNLSPRSTYGPGTVELHLVTCSDDGNGLYACFLWFNWTEGPPSGHSVAKLTGISYPPTNAFYYLGADPTISSVHAPGYFQLWFGTTLAATGNVTATIALHALVR